MKSSDLVIVLAPVVSGYRSSYLTRKGRSVQPFLAAPYQLLEAISSSIPVYVTTDHIKDHLLTHANYSLFQDFFEDILRSGKSPIIFGGDHSISIPATTALAKVYPSVQTVRLDRDLDHGSAGISIRGKEMVEDCRSDNFDEAGMGYLLHHYPTVAITHIGSPVGPGHQGNLLDDSLEDTIGSIIQDLDGRIDVITCNDLNSKKPRINMPCHLSIDIDCYKDVNAKQFGYTPLDGCMTHKHMQALIPRIIASGYIKSIDITELTDNRDHRALEHAGYAFDLILDSIGRYNSGKRI